jgi:hypothetical protein
MGGSELGAFSALTSRRPSICCVAICSARDSRSSSRASAAA